jgi:filamentous hemagglutinin family protein
MNNNKILILFPVSLSIGGILGIPLSVNAQVITQITSDGTSATTFTDIDIFNTPLANCSNSCNITGGTIVNTNALFHSFQDFSVGTGNTVTFTHNPTIENIFARVTGVNLSNIDGIIATQGSANLYLINPRGIVFGANAQLNVGGSFLASTAESIIFANNQNFSAVNPQNPALLTVNIPLGLQMGATSRGITINSRRPNTSPNPFNYAPFNDTGLEVLQGETLALVGNGISLNNGIVVAPEGKVELLSVSNGQVNINTNGQLELSTSSAIITFADIEIDNNSRVIASGNSSGDIEVLGENITIKNNSQVFSDTLGNGSTGTVNVEANVLKLENGGQIYTSSEVLSNSDGAQLKIKAQNIDINGGNNLTGLFTKVADNSTGNGGDLTINTSNLTVDNGEINTNTSGTGNGGNLTINTNDLNLVNNGKINTTATNIGKGGDLTINTSNLNVDNGEINTNTSGTGNGGDLTVNSAQLQLNNQGLISTNTTAGSQGNINIQTNTLSLDNSSISTQPIANATGGNITINTGQFTFNQSKIATDGENSAAGNITIKINSPDPVILNESQITAKGAQGNIFLDVQSPFMIMTNNNLISTQGLGSGAGGNITINTNFLMAINNSDISANAESSFGGRVFINATGIFGTAFREQSTEKSDITASSVLESQINGFVRVDTFGIPPGDLFELSKNAFNPPNLIEAGCEGDLGNVFVKVGRGGIPQSPDHLLNGRVIWQDIRLPDSGGMESPEIINQSSPPQSSVEGDTITIAQGWVVNDQDQVVLVAKMPEVNPLPVDNFTCNGE